MRRERPPADHLALLLLAVMLVLFAVGAYLHNAVTGLRTYWGEPMWHWWMSSVCGKEDEEC